MKWLSWYLHSTSHYGLFIKNLTTISSCLLQCWLGQKCWWSYLYNYIIFLVPMLSRGAQKSRKTLLAPPSKTDIGWSHLPLINYLDTISISWNWCRATIPSTIYCDNSDATCLCANSVFSLTSKAYRHWFPIRAWQYSKWYLTYVSCFIKPLPCLRHYDLRSMIGAHSMHSILMGIEDIPSCTPCFNLHFLYKNSENFEK